MKTFILIFCLVFLMDKTFAAPIVIPGSAFPIEQVASNYQRILLVDTNGTAGNPNNPNTRSNATIQVGDFISQVSNNIVSGLTNVSGSTNSSFSRAVVYHQFTDNVGFWPSNWVSDSGHQMYRMPSESGLLTPLVVTNGALGAQTNIDFNGGVTGPPYVYISVSNSPAFDVVGQNLQTISYLSGTNLVDWGCLFIISPNPLIQANGELNLANPAYLHIGIALGVLNGVGVLFATNSSLQGIGYTGTIPQAIINTIGGVGGSHHNVEVRRVKANSLTVAIDGFTCITVTDTRLNQFWGTNVVWEFVAYNTANAPASADEARTLVQSVYSAKLNGAQPENAASPEFDPTQFFVGAFGVVNNKISIKNGAIVDGQFNSTNGFGIGTAQQYSVAPDYTFGMWNFSGGVESSQGRFGALEVNDHIQLDAAFSVTIKSDTTNSITLDGITMGVGFPTNNVPNSVTSQNGAFITTSNGNAYIRSNGVWGELAQYNQLPPASNYMHSVGPLSGAMVPIFNGTFDSRGSPIYTNASTSIFGGGSSFPLSTDVSAANHSIFDLNITTWTNTVNGNTAVYADSVYSSAGDPFGATLYFTAQTNNVASVATLSAGFVVARSGSISFIPTNNAPVYTSNGLTGSLPFGLTNTLQGRCQFIVGYFLIDAVGGTPMLTLSNELDGYKYPPISVGSSASITPQTNFFVTAIVSTNTVIRARDESGGSGASVGIISVKQIGL